MHIGYNVVLIDNIAQFGGLYTTTTTTSSLYTTSLVVYILRKPYLYGGAEFSLA